MALVYLVRHGQASAGWDAHADPALSDAGRAQAAAMASRIEPLGPLPIVTSPLRRCRQTAGHLAELWGVAPLVEPAISEIPTPSGLGVHERGPWLRQAMAGEWATLGADHLAFRKALVEWVSAQSSAVVAVTHFVAINAVIGAATGDDRLVIARLDTCSVTVVVASGDGRLRLVSTGAEGDTVVR